MGNEESQPLVPFRMTAAEPTVFITVPSLEEVAIHLLIVERVLKGVPVAGIILANELKRAGVKPLEVKVQQSW